jgi:DNA invertase Pin-like site-specific DNA recombinase
LNARAVLYARVSTKDKQDPQLQIDELRRYADVRGWEVTAELIELESGAKTDRPMFERALRLIEGGAAGILASVELSRWGRSTAHLLQVAERLKAVSGELVATRQNIDTTTPAGRLLFSILAALAQFERELTQERVTAGVRRAIAKRGGAWGRQRVGLPQAALDRAAELHRKGFSWEAISAALAKANHLQPARTTGKRQHPARPWSKATLRDALARVGLLARFSGPRPR